MRAVRYGSVGGGPKLCDVEVPVPGPGQVLVRITAAGLCHSDLSVMALPGDRFPYPLPMTLGHEGVGIVAELGHGVTEYAEGDDVAVYLVWGCGRCAQCASGSENYCLRLRPGRRIGPGLGWDGTLAEYLLVDDVRHLVPLGGLDPVLAVPLTDAGLTPYHAIKRALPRLVPGSTAVVIGVGGLGHVAVQLLRATTASRVVALDTSESKLALAAELGAHETIRSDERAVTAVRELTGGLGAAVVLDFVGSDGTLQMAAKVVAVDGEVSIVGIGGGALPVGYGRLPAAVSVSAPFVGTRTELMEVVELARLGMVQTRVETFTLDAVPHAYQLLEQGRVEGRAVVRLE